MFEMLDSYNDRLHKVFNFCHFLMPIFFFFIFLLLTVDIFSAPKIAKKFWKLKMLVKKNSSNLTSKMFLHLVLINKESNIYD